MQRRQFLHAVGLGSALAAPGCLGDDADRTATASDRPSDAADATRTATAIETDSATDAAPTATTAKPSGIYVQTFRERMSMQGTATSGRYEFALMFTVPHDFWTVTLDEFSKTTARPEDSLHLMATVWDAETGTVLPETDLSVEITRDGELVSEEVIYPMLAQPMGFHYGGNFSLPGDGTYTATVSVAGLRIRRTGAFAGAFGEPASVDVPLEYTEETRSEIRTRPFERGGEPGALRPMDTSFPKAVAPAEDELPGTVRGSAMTDGVRFVVTTLDDPLVGDGGQYLAVSARTRYSGYVVPAMALRGTLDRDGSTAFDGPLTRTLDPELGYHYGAAVDGVGSGDELTVSVETIPQVARHEGYETAFRQMDDVSVTV